MTMAPEHNIYLIDLPLLIVLISLVYSATRYDQWSAILYEAPPVGNAAGLLPRRHHPGALPRQSVLGRGGRGRARNGKQDTDAPRTICR